MNELIKKFSEIGMQDITCVGGKNASLGEMYNGLSEGGVKILDGFATTAEAFWLFLKENQLNTPLKDLMENLNREDFSNLPEVAAKARALIMEADFSEKFMQEINDAYNYLGTNADIPVAVRSSATAEDLPNASFAAQYDTFLNVVGGADLLFAVKKCFASLYTDRAMKYREDKGFLHQDVALSVGVQKMVRSDQACAGIGFTIEPESGFGDIIQISGVYGLGENIVQGTVNPDEFYIFKPTLEQGKNALIQKRLGSKEKTMVYASEGDSTTKNIDTVLEKRKKFILPDEQVILLAKWALAIEKYYDKAMDIEWAQDGVTKELYITQARPETVHYSKEGTTSIVYKLKEKGTVIVEGNAIGSKIYSGPSRLLESPNQGHLLKRGEILVTDTTSPDWDPIFKKAGAVITNRGGRTSHAAIVARELGVPAIVGTN